MDKPKLGSPVKADIKRNCLLCSRWTVCRDPNKDMDYACSKFTNQFEQSMHDLFEQEYEEEKKEQRFLKKNKEKLSSKEVRSRFNSKVNITSEHVKNDSIYDLIMETINSGSPLPPDLKINDKDIRKPPNVLEWMIEPEFIGGDQKPFAKQIQIAVHTMGEWCPKCSNEEYFECVPVDDSVDDIKSEVIFLKNGKCPRCKSTKYDLVQDEYLIDPFEIIGILGQRSGKSILSTMMESYNTARWVLTPNLPATFRVLQSSVFTSSYTATTFGQAKGAFWDPLNAIFLDSEWFKTYHKFLNEEGNKLGEELYKHSETMLTYRHKNIVLAPASPSMRSLRGRTRITGVIDELGWFQTGKNKKGEDFERMNAKEVYIAIKRSLSTMRASYIKRFNQGYYQLPKPLLTLISSPKARNDQIMTRYREAEGSREVYRIKAPTWEANPEQTREVLSEEFRTDYVGAMRDYGCEPPMAANAWITDENLIEGAFTGPKNAITVTTRRFRTKSNKLATAGYYKTRRIPTYPNNGGAILGIDAGFSCLEGNTLIATDRGLIKIKDLNDGINKPVVDIDVNVIGKNGIVKATRWLNKGKKDVFKLTTKTGNYIEATEDHKIMVFENGKLVWKELKDIKLGDYLCSNSVSIKNVNKLALNLSNQKSKEGGQIQLKKPNYMDEDLAFLIGAIISEGSITKYQTQIANTDGKYLKKLYKIFYDKFGIKGKVYINRDKGKKLIINGRNTQCNKDYANIVVCSRQLTKWWKEMGLFFDNTLGHKNSYKKVIPWCILQADSESQKAFLASYIEGDGNTKGRINICSKSVKLKKQIQILLNSFGIMTNIERDCISGTTSRDANEYYNIIKPYLISKFNEIRESRTKSSNKFGFLADHVKNVIQNRYVQSNSKNGSLYKNDKGELITLKYFRRFPRITRFVYDSYKKGNYDKFLSEFKKISESEYNKLIYLLKNEYRFTSVTKKTYVGKKNVYDLTIENGKAPAFTANGLIVHNCNSFAFAVGYPTSIPDPEDEEEEDVIVGMNIALVGEIIPRKDYPISFTAVYKQLLQPLCSEFNVAVVISDTWQNKKLQQDLEDSLGISYFEYKLGLQEFIDYREGIYENIIQHPKLDMPFEDISSMTLEDYPNCFNKFPVAHLAFQMMTVQNTGTAVIKGEEGTTDDILRACVICHAGLQNEEVLDEVLSFSTATQPIQALGTVALASSGRSSNHSGMGSQNTSNIGVTASYGGSSRPATGNSSSSIGILGRK